MGVIVGVGDEAGHTLDVDTWLMSCRVLGRTADAEMLAQLSRRAAERGYQAITGTYVPTAKNGMVRELFAKFGFEPVSADADRTTRGVTIYTTRGRCRTNSSKRSRRGRARMTLHQRLEDVFRSVFNNDDLVLHDEMTSADVPGWDSFEHINLMFALEEEFGVQFVGNELAELENIGALKGVLEERSQRPSRR